MAVGRVLRGGLLVGVAVGVGAAIVAPTVWRVMRPAAKQALRAGIAGYGAARTAAARAGEEVEDLVAEVVYEIDEDEAGASDFSEEDVSPEEADIAARTPARGTAKTAAPKSSGSTAAKKSPKAAPKRKAPSA